MSDSSDEDVAPVAPRPRKRRKLVPLADDSVGSSSCTASTSLTNLSGAYLTKTSEIDAVPTITTKKASLDVSSCAEKPKKDYSFLISSSSDEENEDHGAKETGNRSPSPPPPPPANRAAPPTPDDECCWAGGRRRKRRTKRKSAPARPQMKGTTRKAKQGIKAVEQLRSLQSRLQDETWSENLRASFRMMHEGMTEALKVKCFTLLGKSMYIKKKSSVVQ